MDEARETKTPAEDSQNQNKPIFRDIAADDATPEITEIESLCVNCEEQGTTRLFLTRIPFFREVIIASFDCTHCGYRNAELQPGGAVQDRGVAYTLEVKMMEDLNRQVVQTQYATISIPHIEFEIPPGKSCLTTIEGVLDRAIEALEQGQIIRRIEQPEIAANIDAFLEKLKSLKNMEQPFTMKLDDPSGNSFLENPLAPSRDPVMVVAHYARTKAQDHQVGIYTEEEIKAAEDGDSVSAPSQTKQGIVGQDDGQGFNTQNEVLSFNTECNFCGAHCDTNMKLVNIPHFKEVVIMATLCENCGRRDNEVKSSGGIESMGTRHELRMESTLDMARDLLKSETAKIKIPDMDFDMDMGTLGGKFTTVEGILVDIQKQLKDVNPFFRGDSSQPETNNRLSKFCDQLDQITKGKLTGITLILEDAAGNSYIQSLCDPDPDPQLKVTKYERSFEENEDLGLNDMKTENYS